MRTFLAILFLTIFSFQVLPLKVIGKLISSSQSMEDVHDDGTTGDVDGKVIKFADDQIVDHQQFDFFTLRLAFDHKVSVYIHTAETLPVMHPAKIPTPPPNC